MKPAPIPKNEAERLASLLEYQILDSAPELAYDDIARIASTICQTPIALISFIDGERQWFKSHIGVDVAETSRDIAFCAYAINNQGVFIVPDATQDDRFKDNPFVTGAANIKYYAGAPLINPKGFAIGTLCVIDNQARQLTPEQINSLEALARQVMAQLELRKSNSRLMENFSELQQYTRRVTEVQLQLAYSAKMAALGEMSAGMAHEINNPLAIIQGKVQHIKNCLQKGKLDPQKMENDFLKIDSTVTRISKILKSLLQFSRNSEEDDVESIKISTAINDALEICGERFKAHAIEVSVEGDLDVQVECRSTQISQIIFNLLANAHDAIEKLSEKWIRVQVLSREDMLYVYIVDSGMGIPDEVSKMMMQPFFTTKDVGKGTGLGLSISLGIAQRHGGRLFLDSTATNTTFVLELPLVQTKINSKKEEIDFKAKKIA